MIKQLTRVGNSKAVILPSALVKKYKLDRVVIEETDEGILIRPVGDQNRFQKKVEKLRKKKSAVYKRMAMQANEPEMIRYYMNTADNLADADPDIIEE